ncbi:hypothetical protein J6590_006493 [Homalodisca vitripennis]|nr:hypothetical protein J6590_006493 [Homalodisca vitripennis]
MQIELIVSRLLKTPLRPQVCKNVCSYHGGWNSLSSSRRWRKSFFLQRCYLHSSTNYNMRLTQNAYTTKEMLTNVFTDVDGVQRPIEDYSEKTKVMFYEMFKEVNEEYVNVQKFITAIQVTGIQPHTDPRLKDFINGLTKAYRESGILGGSSESQKLSKEKFMDCIQELILFNLFASEFPSCVQNCTDHQYVDDCQLHQSYEASSIKCSADNGLKLNIGKCSIIHVAPHGFVKTLGEHRVSAMLGGRRVAVYDTVGTLGVILESGLLFTNYITHTIQQAILRLRGLYRFRSLLPSSVKLRLTKSLVLSTNMTPDSRTGTEFNINKLISPNLMIISRALRHDLVIPDFGAFQKQIEEFYMKCAENKEGHVASYLPQLARQNPDTWAVSVCTIDGQRFSMGEANVAFTLHSLTKPMTYALALNELGDETVHRYIGQEPSGRNANELVLDDNKKPHNPMISAGAILVGALLQTLCKPEMGLAEKFDFVVNYIKRLAGGEFIGFNNSVFLAEKAAGDRNYALGFYLREHKCYPKGTDLRQLIDFFHQCCSLEGNCNSLSVIAATFANGGVCPLTGDRILEPDAIRDVLSLMHSCGMYEYSGQFAFKKTMTKEWNFGELMLGWHEDWPQLFGNILWSDEARFHIGGIVNRHNCHYCEPRITAIKFIGPYLLCDTMNADRYPQMLREYVWPTISQWENINELIFMQDGAPPHFAIFVHE